MEIAATILTGYLLGSLSPSALLGKIKQADLRSQGTKNLGASNTMLVIGKKFGALVMIFDIFKGFFAAKLAKILFPQLAFAQLLAGLSAVVGHIFPFYLKFKGGKGLAAFGGMVLACDPLVFLCLLVLGIILMLLTNASAAMPISAGFLFPILTLIRSQSLTAFILAAAAGGLIIVKHWSNIGKARRGEDIKIRSFVKNGFNKD